MSTGYDEDGVEVLRCIGPPDAKSDGGTDPDEFVPTAFLGMFPLVVAYCPTYALGVNDFSMECWFRWAMGNTNITTDIQQYLLGFFQQNGAFADRMAIVLIENNSYQLEIQFDATPGGAVDATTGWDAVPGPTRGWMHLAANFDRSGNLEYFVNTTSIDSVAINANDMGTRTFMPLGSGTNCAITDDVEAENISGTPDDYPDFTSWTQPRCVQGPVAMHNRLLTAAEIADSYRRKWVQNLSGVTQVLWDWREITGVTGWDYDPQHVNNLMRFAAADTPMGLPLGANATVIVPDLSGNSNDLTLPTNTAYGDQPGRISVTGNKAWCGFVSDPFWR